MDKANSDVKLVTEVLYSEIGSIKRQLDRAEQQITEHILKEEEILQKQKELEEENTSLKSALAHCEEKLKHFQPKHDGGDPKRSTDMVDNLLKIEVSDLENKLRLKCSEIQVLSDCREKLETRLNGMEVERKRQHEQILQLVRVKANLTEELDYQQQEAIQGYEELKKFLALKVSEVSGLQKEREALQIEIATMRDELEVRKIEVSIIQEDFKTERSDRERMATQLNDLTGTLEIEKIELLEKLQSAENGLQKKETIISDLEKILIEQRAIASNRKSSDPVGEREDYKARFFDVQQQFSKQKQIWSQKLQAFDLLKRTMKTQYEGEMMKMEEECSDKLSNLSKEMNANNQKIAQYEQDLQLARKHLQKSITEQYKLFEKLRKLEQENAMLKDITEKGNLFEKLQEFKGECAKLKATTAVDDNSARFTKVLQQVTTQMGDLSEEERTSLKSIVDQAPQALSVEEEEKEIKLICEQMEELRYERQIAKKTDLMMALDPNLTCHKCNKYFRLGEIQKFKIHVENCLF